MKSVDDVMYVYDRELHRDPDDQCAVWAFSRAMELLTSERWFTGSNTHPAYLARRASAYRDPHASPRRQELLERSIIALCDRLRYDVYIYIWSRVTRDEERCTFGEYLGLNLGDLEVTVALSRLWAGAAWAPVGSRFMVSFAPVCHLPPHIGVSDTDQYLDELAQELESEVKLCM